MKPVVLGILTTYPNGASCRRPRRPQWEPMAELIRLGEQAGVLAYVFSPAGVDWTARRVLGFRCGGSSDAASTRWRSGTFPLPDVVYNRVPTRIAEGRSAVQRTLRRFYTTLSGRVFNPHYLNKSGVARALRGDPDVGRYVPATSPFGDGSNLQRFAQRHRIVYVKSVGGSLGNDMMRLSPTQAGGWLLKYNAGPFRTQSMRSYEWGALLSHIRRLTKGRPFVMQQGIRLATADGRPFDLRILVQKLPTGRWNFTGGAARVAGRGQITTHVPRGGRRLPMNTALEKAFGPAAAGSLAADVAGLATRAAHVLERKLGRPFVEMSLDIGVDRDGHPWIFEMNAKPLHFDERDIQKRRNMHLLAFAKAVTHNGSA